MAHGDQQTFWDQVSTYMPWYQKPAYQDKNFQSLESLAQSVDNTSNSLQSAIHSVQQTAHSSLGKLNDSLNQVIAQPMEYLKNTLSQAWPSIIKHQSQADRYIADTSSQIRNSIDQFSNNNNVQSHLDTLQAITDSWITNLKDKIVSASEYTERLGQRINDGTAFISSSSSASSSASSSSSPSSSSSSSSSWFSSKSSSAPLNASSSSWSFSNFFRSSNPSRQRKSSRPHPAFPSNTNTTFHHHAFLSALVLAATAFTLYIFPETFLWSVSGLLYSAVRIMPHWIRDILPVKTIYNQLLQHDRRKHRLAQGDRHEAVLLLGADSPAGLELALYLENLGFIVIATVCNPDAVPHTESRSKHNSIKALVLNPSYYPANPQAFNRAISTCLSLRYPLNHPGDPYAGTNAANLVSVVNLWPIQSVHTMSSSADSSPTTSSAQLNSALALYNERVISFNAALRAVMPFLQQGLKRAFSSDAVILTVLRSSTSFNDYPSLADVCAADHALVSFITSLSRESKLTNPRLHTVTFDVPNTNVISSHHHNDNDNDNDNDNHTDPLDNPSHFVKTIASIIFRELRAERISLNAHSRLYRILGQFVPTALTDNYLKLLSSSQSTAPNKPPSTANRLGGTSVTQGLNQINHSPNTDEKASSPSTDHLSSQQRSPSSLTSDHVLISDADLDNDLASSIGSFVNLDRPQL